MILNKETIYHARFTNKKIKVVREFDAPVEKVWKAWTESRITGPVVGAKTMESSNNKQWISGKAARGSIIWKDLMEPGIIAVQIINQSFLIKCYTG